MALTLGNNLTGGVSRTVIESNRQASTLGESMTSGLNQNIESVDAFLGNSLRDNQLILGAIAKNTNYSTNMLATAKEYMNILAQSLQEGLTTIGSSGQVSAEKLATLEQSLSDTRTQVSLLIKTADFDNKALLTGGVQDLSVQVGLSTADKLNFSINNLGEGRLFRSGVTSQLINYLAADVNRSRYYAANPNRLGQDMLDTKNIVTESLNAATPAHTLTNRQLATALTGIRGGAGTENLKALSGVTPVFNNRARAELLAAWTNIFTKDLLVHADANTAQIAGAAAEAVVLGMENKFDIVRIKNDVNAAASTAAAVNNANIGTRAELLVENLLNGGVATLNLNIRGHSAIAADAATANIADAFTNGLAVVGNDLAALDVVVQGAGGLDAAAASLANAGEVAALVEDMYLVYHAVAAGTYDANKMESTIDKTTTAIIEKVLGDAPSKEELVNRIKDDADTDLNTDEDRAWSHNLFMSALDSIRNNQASVQNQQTNILGAADALRATNNVTEKAADSYLKTDYVLAAQQYSELIRTIVAAITALQAANKIPEAAQQLLNGLTR